MIVDFKTMPDDSRIWIYQSNRDFNEFEIGIINDKTISFLDNWQAHGKDLECSYSIIDKRFIIIAVNESVNPIGGCSIDFSLQLIKDRYNSKSIEQHSQNCVRDRIETDKKHPKCRVIGSHWVSSQWEITR